MNKIRLLYTLCLPLMAISLALALGGCSRSKFKVSGEIKGLGNQSLTLVYITGDGVRTARAKASNDKFELEGRCGGPAMASLLDAGQQQVALLLVEPGDNVRLEGERTSLKVHGNEADEAWYEFRNKNQNIYNAPDNAAMLNAAIEQEVKARPDKLSSLLLALFDYDGTANPAAQRKLLGAVTANRDVAAAITACTMLSAKPEQPSGSVLPMSLYERGGQAFDEISPRDGAYTLLMFWDSSTPRLSSSLKALGNAYSAYHGKGLNVADVYLEADTTLWGSLLSEGQPMPWQHYWAPGGPVEASLKQVAIAQTPLYIVVDSTGGVAYRGKHVMQALHTVDEKLRGASH